MNLYKLLVLLLLLFTALLIFLLVNEGSRYIQSVG